MKKDDEQLSNELEEMNNAVGNHNDLISKSDRNIPALEKKMLSPFFASAARSEVTYNYNMVYQFTSRVWISCVEKEDIMGCIELYIKNATPRAGGGYFQFENLPVAQGDGADLNTVEIALYGILRNKEIIKIIKDLKSSVSLLDNKKQNIRNLMAPVVDSIDQDLYTRKIKGCCTNITLLRKI